MTTMNAPRALTEVDLEHRFAELRDREREAVRALGIATAKGLAGEAARAELRRLREELEATTAALRFLESH